MTYNTKTTKNNAEIHEAVRAAYGGRVEDAGCCLAGASLIGEYLDAIRNAGFEEPEVEMRAAADVLAADDPVVKAATDAVAGCCGQGPGLEEITASIVSATVLARKL